MGVCNSARRRRIEFRFFASERGWREEHTEHDGAHEKIFQKVGRVGRVWRVDPTLV